MAKVTFEMDDFSFIFLMVLLALVLFSAIR